MEPLSFEEARRAVVERVKAGRRPLGVERVALDQAAGRVLARDVVADRDYPPLDRSMRDGFAVRAADAPGTLTVIGEVKAGDRFEGCAEPGQAVEIMTGAPMPEGTDSVVMIEHVEIEGDRVRVEDQVEWGQNVSPRGVDARRGDVVVPAGKRIGYAETAMLASAGAVEVDVFRRPRVAILATGDELVEVGCVPEAHQIRNSNSHSLAVQVMRAEAEASILPVAPDLFEATRELVHDGLEADLLLISGGVSAGKYDVAEVALEHFGAKFYFDRVLIQPGQPLVFGEAKGTFFFGLPGNPASTMVCFELFARAALELIAGQEESLLKLTEAALGADFRHKPGLTRFLPARLDEEGRLWPERWSGSGDIAAQVRANAFMVAEADKPEYKAGERIRVLLK